MTLWLVDAGITLALLGITEVMYRAGRSARGRKDEATRSQVSTVQAATLGLLALSLGFTMSMAEGRFNFRRLILVDEANAIGTTYLRADFLSEPERSQSRELLRKYVDSRRAYFRASVEEAPAATARSQAILRDLWERGAAVAVAQPERGDILATYIESLNDTIDLEATRDLAIQARIPPTIYLLLVMVALVAMGITGYVAGLTGPRSVIALYVVPILIALAYSLIADLDRTRAGFISTGDRPMERVQRSMTGGDQNRIDAATDAVMPFWPPM